MFSTSRPNVHYAYYTMNYKIRPPGQPDLNQTPTCSANQCPWLRTWTCNPFWLKSLNWLGPKMRFTLCILSGSKKLHLGFFNFRYRTQTGRWPSFWKQIMLRQNSEIDFKQLAGPLNKNVYFQWEISHTEFY